MRSFSRIAAVVFVALLGCAAIAADLAPRHIRAKPQHSRIGPGLRDDLLIVKFRDAARVRMREGRLVSLTGTPVQSANLLTADSPDVTIERMLRRPEAHVDHSREQAQIRAGRELADLNGYFAIRLTAPDNARAEALLDALNALDVVEIAYAEPVPEYAAIIGKGDRAQVVAGGTPDFEPLQDYHDPAPTGINVAAAWALPGGRGEGVKIIDVELGYRWTHEDMPAPFFEGGPVEDSDHGVAVLGVIAAPDNGFGVTGIAHGAQVGSRHTGDVPTAVAFDEAAANVSPGDFVVIELQAAGPTPGGGVTVVPLEYYQANFDVIETATANGVIFVAAAGNGTADLDHAVFEGLFDRDVRDSGAIMVGASDGAALVAAGFSNYGSRVDLSGWGFDVVTTGYGDLQGGSPNVWYTAGFSGTSSATPIVTGALAVLQGIYRDASGGVPAPGRALAELLIATGTPTVGVNIGPRPNLAQAIPALQAGLADLSGVVRDQATTLPLAGALVRVLESGAQVLTAADGTWDLRFAPGSWTVRVAMFGYMPFDYAVNVVAGGSDHRNVDLTALSTSVVSGRVVGQAGNGLANVEVRLVDTPLPAVLTNALGKYTIPGVPAGFQGLAQATRADLTPDVREVSTVLGPADVNFRLIPPQENFEADNGGFSGSGEWEWGIPTYPQGPQAHGGMRLWGTDLDGTYATVNQSLTFTVDVPVQSPRLAYWHWHDVWGPYDGIRVEISENGGATFDALPPVGGYDEPCVWDFSTCKQGWSFRSEGWIPGVHDLQAYAGQPVVIRLRLQASGFGTGAGWYVDDLGVFEDVDILDTSVCVEIALDLPSTDPHLSLRRPDDCPTSGVLPAQIDLISGNVANLTILGGAVRLGPITQIACANTAQAHLVVSLAPPPAGETRFFLAREVSQTHYGLSSSGLPRLAGPGGCP